MDFIRPNNPVLIGIVFVIIIVLIMALSSTKSGILPAESELVSNKDGLAKAPELRGISGYVNADENFSIEGQRGKVVLVDFWTYSCINCIRTIPHLNEWHENYSTKGLVIVGVHSPEFEFEKNFDNVKNAIREQGIEYPVVLDNEFRTWRAYQNNWWPHKYLVDAEGFIRYDHIGEGSYEEIEKEIVKLLIEIDSSVELGNQQEQSTLPDFREIGTQEIYLGSGFARAPLGNPKGFALDNVIKYSLPEKFMENLAYLEGAWVTKNDYSKLVSEEGRVGLNFKAKQVNIVAGADKPVLIRVFIDGDFVKELVIEEEKLYTLFTGDDYLRKNLIFDIVGGGFQLFTFTFG